MSENNGAQKLLHKIHSGHVSFFIRKGLINLFSLSEVDVGLDKVIKKEYKQEKIALKKVPQSVIVPSRELEELECFIVREKKFEQSEKNKRYLKIDTSKSFRRKLSRILAKRKEKFCEDIERDHNFAYMLILLGFPLTGLH